MLREDANDSSAANITPCEACGNPSTCEVWGHPTCFLCAALWGEARPTYGQIFEKYGKDCVPAKVYLDFTERWIASRNAKRGAA